MGRAELAAFDYIQVAKRMVCKQCGIVDPRKSDCIEKGCTGAEERTNRTSHYYIKGVRVETRNAQGELQPPEHVVMAYEPEPIN